MARANLSLDSEVSAAFLAAQDDVSVRALQVRRIYSIILYF